MKSINIQAFYEDFKKEYTFLYDNRDNIAGFSEAVDGFDNFIKTENGKRLASDFYKYRQDFITSDREAAAFMFALDTITA